MIKYILKSEEQKSGSKELDDLESSTEIDDGFFTFRDDEVVNSMEENDQGEIKQSVQTKVWWCIKVMLIMIVELCATIICVMPYLILLRLWNIVQYIASFWKQRSDFIDDFLTPFIQIMMILASLFVIQECFLHTDSDEKTSSHLSYLNAFYLFATQILVKTYIKTVHNESDNITSFWTLKNFFGDDNLNVVAGGLRYMHSIFIFDVTTLEQRWRIEYRRILNYLNKDLSSQVFNTFISSDNDPTTFDHSGYEMLSGQIYQLSVFPSYVIALTVSFCVKTTLTLAYIVARYHFNIHKIIQLILLTLFYTNTSIILAKILTSGDLRRKTRIIKELNGALNLCSNGEKVQYSQCIDVTSNMSMETWDTTRRVVLDLFQEQQHKMEFCYICLFFYYVFVCVVIVSAFGKVYVLLDKDSIHLDPIMVVSNTLDLVFLNIILFKRIWHGDRFNKALEESEERVSQILAVFEDLLQLYDYYFTKKVMTTSLFLQSSQVDDPSLHDSSSQLNIVQNQSRNNGHNFSIYEAIVDKIKHNADFYINKELDFQGYRYDKGSTKYLHIQMLTCSQINILRLQDQIRKDIKLKSYEFLQISKFSFQKTLMAAILTSLTLLPPIIESMIEFFCKIDK